VKPIPELSEIERWRLLLGEASAPQFGAPGEAGSGMDEALAWLYGREDGTKALDTLDRQGGDGPSQLTVPEWIDSIHTLFPKETIERLEKDAIERYGIDDIVTNIEVLRRAKPNPQLLNAVLRTKHLMNQDVLSLARDLVAAVVQEMIDKLAKRIDQAFSGKRKPTQTRSFGPSSLFAASDTVRRNLQHFDVNTKRLLVREPRFFVRSQRQLEPWQIILLVDQSGSMLDSVIHSAVTAACLWSLPGIQTHLVAFDSNVVDLTTDVSDPVELLMQVQLGGGTDIANAVGYAAGLIQAPKRSIVVVISDFYEGSNEHSLVSLVRDLVAQGTTVLGLAALNHDADPVYDHAMAQKLTDVGAHVGAMTPGELANWLAEVIG